MPLTLALFGLLIQGTYGVIYRLNENEFARMPPVFYLEPYEPCVGRGGMYCTVRFQLTSDTGSDLADMIRKYSAHTATHYDHTILEYGICLTKCKSILNTNNTSDRDKILEGCLNDTISRDYELKAKISEPAVCHKSDETIPLDAGDIVVAGVILLLLVMNLVGSFYDFYVKENKGSVLICFSVQRNWRSLVAPAGEGPEPRITRLKSIYGIRATSMMLVISGHSVLPFVISTNNTHYIEESFHNQMYLLLFNCSPIVQTFFIISGFLLIFNLQLYAERDQLSWTLLPRGVLMRWLRLIPAYAAVLAVTATWLRFFGPGPLWQRIGGDAVTACRSKWWVNLLSMNNYDDGYPQCMPHAWYIAADLQLHTVGLIVGVMTKGGVRKVVLLLLLVVGLVGPAAHTYFQDLDGGIMMRPEAVRFLFVNKDPTFNHVYKRGHTNLACFVIGLSLGLLVYHWQKIDFKVEEYLSYRYLYWSLFPAMLLVFYSGSVFYRPAPRIPLYLRVIFAALLKPLFGCLIAVLVIGMVFKYEKVYRGVLEWGGWGVPARLSYCTYVVHMLLVRILAGTRTSLVYTSFIHVFHNAIGTVVISYLAAVPLALLVEIPFHRVVKMATTSKKTSISSPNVPK